ncbi:MAG: hypothetical protein GDA43_07415 [Hormoscilla sp. SP5CHS1]|nr:hypothetical protein [Hormoscilla sp. SP5CHS1]
MVTAISIVDKAAMVMSAEIERQCGQLLSLIFLRFCSEDFRPHYKTSVGARVWYIESKDASVQGIMLSLRYWLKQRLMILAESDKMTTEQLLDKWQPRRRRTIFSVYRFYLSPKTANKICFYFCENWK